jgi:hypothetical protein
MKIFTAVFAGLCLLSSLTFAQEAKKAGVFGAEEIKKLTPATFFFDGQSAQVQLRNTVGFRTPGGKTVLVGLMDVSGYATDVQQKFQGFFITETKLDIGGSQLSPGEYGFGFTKDGKFFILDVAANDVLSTSSANDDKVAHPVPLKIVEDGAAYKLYAGRKWVALKPE